MAMASASAVPSGSTSTGTSHAGLSARKSGRRSQGFSRTNSASTRFSTSAIRTARAGAESQR